MVEAIGRVFPYWTIVSEQLERKLWGTITMKNSMAVPQKLSLELPHDPTILLLGIDMDKTFTEKDTCTPMFTAALFTIAKTWRLP